MLAAKLLSQAQRNNSDPSSSNVISLLHMDGANNSTVFTDVKGRTWTANGGAKISTAQSKFGGASARFSASGDNIAMATVASDSISTGDFTLELWAYWNSFGSDKKYIVCADSVSAYWQFRHDSATGPGLVYNAGSTIVSQGSNSGWSTGVWYHVALVRSGDVFTIYRDGVAIASAIAAATLGHYGTLTIGGTQVDAGSSSDSWFDEVRITKGVARYIGNFSPPNAPFGS